MARVLVLDDDRLVRRVIARTLRGAGHVVVEADCCEAARGTDGYFDVAVLDVDLPDGSGVDVGEVFTATERVGACIFHTAKAHTDPRGLGPLLVKPSPLRRLLDLVRTLGSG